MTSVSIAARLREKQLAAVTVDYRTHDWAEIRLQAGMVKQLPARPELWN